MVIFLTSALILIFHNIL
jgi:hypothetical protein